MSVTAFIGCGNMGFAIAKAVREKEEVILYSPNYEKTAAKAATIGAKCAKSLSEALMADRIVLAVKPQVLPSLYKDLQGTDAVFYSIAAGISLEALEAGLKTKKVVRFMPNLAASEKKSVTAVTWRAEQNEEIKTEALAFASLFGSAFFLEEKDFKGFIGISGSAIAYVFEFMHALALGGTKAGIPYAKSLEIARDTLFSAAELQKATGDNPIALMTRVCSAAGTTIEGVEALQKGGFDATVIDAVTAAVNRNTMLEKAQEIKND
jgi:pyrroline-5-carboxylate reductase